MNGLMHRNKQHLYSITASASASSIGGMSRPNYSLAPTNFISFNSSPVE
jgi:hypothetical protein